MGTEDLLKVSAVRRLVVSGKLRERRQNLLLSAREMAAAIPASPAAVSRWESAERLPRPAQALRLAEILGVTADSQEAA